MYKLTLTNQPKQQLNQRTTNIKQITKTNEPNNKHLTQTTTKVNQTAKHPNKQASKPNQNQNNNIQ